MEEYKTEDNYISDADASARQTCAILTETVCLASLAATCGFVCLLEGDVYQLGVTLDLYAEIPRETKSGRRYRRAFRYMILFFKYTNYIYEPKNVKA